MSRSPPTAGVVLLAFAFILCHLFPVAGGTHVAFFLLPSPQIAKIERQRILLCFALSISCLLFTKDR